MRIFFYECKEGEEMFPGLLSLQALSLRKWREGKFFFFLTMPVVGVVCMSFVFLGGIN